MFWNLPAALVWHSFCIPGVPRSNPKPGFFNFLSFFYLVGVQIQVKIAKFQLPTTKMPHPSGGLYGRPEQPQEGGEWQKVAEIGLKCKINSKNALLLHRKNEKFIFFKNPSFKFENLLVAYCPHVWVWKTSLRSLLNFFPYWSTLDEHCDLSDFEEHNN